MKDTNLGATLENSEQQTAPAGLSTLVADHEAELGARLDALVAQRRLKVVEFNGAAGLMVQAKNGPCLYISHKDPSDLIQHRRTVRKLKAFLNAIETAQD